MGRMHERVELFKGEFVGSVSIALHDDGIAFIDQFFVLPQFRGSGIGRQLFEAIFDERIKSLYNVGLHSELAVSEYYNKKHGFSHFNEIFIDVIHISNIMKCVQQNKKFRLVFKIITNAAEALNDIFEVDRRIWNKSRKNFLTEWIQRTDGKFLAVYRDDEMLGYGVIRHASCKNGYLFGPIYAFDEEVFLTIFDGLIEQQQQQQQQQIENDAIIEIRSPSINSNRLYRLLDHRATLNSYSKYITQYTKQVPNCDYEPIYAISDTSISI
uniref:N-acetyltransferase domain-containing protein n=1 Tax=Ascaris lumbricoides TaxID=6252 RepID=A0A0M3ISQ8_ASCLU